MIRKPPNRLDHSLRAVHRTKVVLAVPSADVTAHISRKDRSHGDVYYIDKPGHVYLTWQLLCVLCMCRVASLGSTGHLIASNDVNLNSLA